MGHSKTGNNNQSRKGETMGRPQLESQILFWRAALKGQNEFLTSELDIEKIKPISQEDLSKIENVSPEKAKFA